MALSKLFISYRSLDSDKVDTIKTNLLSDRTAQYSIWQDKDSISGGQDWWEQIVEGIEKCEVFIFAVSRASLDSVVCLAELNYAYKLNCPIIPVVLEGEFFYDPATGKNNIDYWENIPKEIANTQFLFYKGTSFYNDLKEAISEFESNPKTRLNPKKKPSHPLGGKTDVQNYQEACEFASNSEFEKAEQLFRTLINRSDSRFNKNSQEWLDVLDEYQEIIHSDIHESTRYEVETMWEVYKQKFPKPFITLFDPKNFAERFVPLNRNSSVNISLLPTSDAQQDLSLREVIDVYQSTNEDIVNSVNDVRAYQALSEKIIEPSSPVNNETNNSTVLQRIRAILPKPFDWCLVPEGVVIIAGKPISVPAFMIGKYTITNQQFEVFVKSKDGYRIGEWWSYSKNAIQWRSVNSSSSPSHTPSNINVRFRSLRPPQLVTEISEQKSKKKPPEKQYPRTNVNWYESMAFCSWLSSKTDLTIGLPTPQQWQRAAKADLKRTYSWGNVPTPDRANYSIRQTSTVI